MMKLSVFTAMAAVSVVLAGCSSTPTEEGTKTTVAPATPVISTVGQAAERKTTSANAGNVYFDFDRSEIKSEFVPVIKAHAAHLSANPSMNVTLEGHCDERGTREYNLGLGERRAKSVADMLMANGISANRIKTISFGEDRPAVEGHNESAWAKNRRVEFVYE